MWGKIIWLVLAMGVPDMIFAAWLRWGRNRGC
jgi:hypothetical protein